jgi:hypothetical protein
MNGKDPESARPAESGQVTKQWGSGNISVQVDGNNVSVVVGQQRAIRLIKYQGFTSNRSAPFQQLAPYNRTARFVGRETELSALAAWLTTSDLVSVRLLIGTAGVGKTRLAIELAAHAEANGWTAGFLRTVWLQDFVEQSSAREWIWITPTLVIVDYASQKAELLRNWMEILQDYKDLEPGSENVKLRILLLDRAGSRQSGWLSRVIGLPGGYSDRRIELCDPDSPITLQTIVDESSCLSIVQDSIEAAGGSCEKAREIFLRIRNSSNAAQVLGNPLLLQVAAGIAPTGKTGSTSYSAETLLGAVVDRELANMRKEWDQAHVPEYVAADLVRLAGVVTLMHGATSDQILTILDSERVFSKLARFVEEKNIISLLGSVLNTNDELGLRPLEPDLVGEMFLLRSDVAPSVVANAYRLKPLFVGPTIWRIAADFSKDGAAQAIIVEWFRAVLRSLERNALGLDTFIKDNAYETPEIVQSLLAEALEKITQSLKGGRDTIETLLYPAGRNRLIPLALIREADALVASHQLAKATDRIREARSTLLSLGNTNDFTWFRLYMVEVNCKRAQGINAAEQLPIIDEAIDFCRRRISSRNFFEQGPLHNPDLQLRALESTLELGGLLTSRSVRAIAESNAFPDFRLSFADLVLSRIEVKSAQRDIVIEALGYLEQMIRDGVYAKLRRQSDLISDLTRRGEKYIPAHKLNEVTHRDIQRGDRTMRKLTRRDTKAAVEQLVALGWVQRKKGRKEYAGIVEQAAHKLIRTAEVFRSKTIYLIVKLSGHVSAACKDDERDLRRSSAERVIRYFNLFSDQGFVPDPLLLAELCASMLLGQPKEAAGDLRRRFMPLYIEILKKSCTLEHVEQLMNLIQEVSRVLDYSDNDKLLASLARNSASDVLSAVQLPGRGDNPGF